jgi:tetratricopeptide (TPR) repeat protein
MHYGSMMLLVSAGVALAQQDAAFAAAYERFALATPANGRELAVAASDRYLAIDDAAARAAHRVAGLHATTKAERWALALELAGEARTTGSRGPLLVMCHLEALVRSGAFVAFVEQAIADLPTARAAVHGVLATEEARLLPMAEKALRAGDPRAARFVFAELAAIEPAAAHRLGNFALCLRQLGEIAVAREVYERARGQAPDDIELENDYGLFLRANGDRSGAVRAFRRAWSLDLQRDPQLRARGPAITNLVHMEALWPGSIGGDPLPDAAKALAVRPDATMLKRLVLDVVLDRLTGR